MNDKLREINVEFCQKLNNIKQLVKYDTDGYDDNMKSGAFYTDSINGLRSMLDEKDIVVSMIYNYKVHSAIDKLCMELTESISWGKDIDFTEEQTLEVLTKHLGGVL